MEWLSHRKFFEKDFSLFLELKGKKKCLYALSTYFYFLFMNILSDVYHICDCDPLELEL